MKDFFKNNWTGIVISAGMGLLTFLTYIGAKCEGWVECYNETEDNSELVELMEMVKNEIESE